MKTLTLFIVLITFSSLAQTNLSGGIYSSQNWTVAGSPYIITGNLVVFDGVEITIDPGVSVKFNASASLELRGKLSAVGSETDSIIFTSNSVSPSTGAWNGITVIGTTDPIGVGDQVTMEYVLGEYANTFINLDLAYHGPYIFKNCRFQFNAKVNHDGGSPATNFDYCIFQSNTQALDWCQFDSRASHCYFYNNGIGLEGISIVDTCYFSGHSNYALSPYGVTSGCTIENNVLGVKTGFNAVNHSFVNNTVINNQVGIEISSFFNGSQTFTGNKICNNSVYNLKLLTSNNADLGDNCWCAIDQSEIQNTIYDGYDNVAYGLVSLSPVSTTCGEPLIVEVKENNPDDLLISAFPNPFNDIVLFRTNADDSDLKLSIYDATGRLLFNEIFTSEITFSGSHLSSGIYTYTIENEKGQVSIGKICKE